MADEEKGLYRLNEVLKEKNMSQYKFGKQLGMDSGQVSKIVNNKNYNPTLKTVKRHADAIGCKMRDLINE